MTQQTVTITPAFNQKTDLKCYRVEDAPKDGTPILVWDGKVWLAVRWSGWGGGIWQCCSTGMNLNNLSYSARRWVPMLPAPVE